MKNGGLIPWTVTAICETFRISCLMGRHLVRGGDSRRSHHGRAVALELSVTTRCGFRNGGPARPALGASHRKVKTGGHIMSGAWPTCNSRSS